jgi:hypothetical protein
MPLPETADELCAVAHDLGVDPTTHLYLGARATEAEVKQLCDNKELQTYKIVAFATHGAVAGDISPSAEPGLILTPPKQATEIDDGYLSASEIAGLKLDADWVILSACNTAAGGVQVFQRSGHRLCSSARAPRGRQADYSGNGRARAAFPGESRGRRCMIGGIIRACSERPKHDRAAGNGKLSQNR